MLSEQSDTILERGLAVLTLLGNEISILINWSVAGARYVVAGRCALIQFCYLTLCSRKKQYLLNPDCYSFKAMILL